MRTYLQYKTRAPVVASHNMEFCSVGHGPLALADQGESKPDCCRYALPYGIYSLTSIGVGIGVQIKDGCRGESQATL